MGGGDYDDVNSFIYDIGVTYIGATHSLFFDANGDVDGPGHDICEYTSGFWSTYYNCDGIWQPRFGVIYDDTVVNVPLGFLNPLTGPIAVYAEGFTVSWDVAEDHLNEIYGFLNFEVYEEGCTSLIILRTKPSSIYYRYRDYNFVFCSFINAGSF